MGTASQFYVKVKQAIATFCTSELVFFSAAVRSDWRLRGKISLFSEGEGQNKAPEFKNN